MLNLTLKGENRKKKSGGRGKDFNLTAEAVAGVNYNGQICMWGGTWCSGRPYDSKEQRSPGKTEC